MVSRFKKIFSLLGFGFGFLLPLPSLAQVKMPNAQDLLSEVSAKSYMAVDAKSGEVLFEKNSTELRIPASITKVLSAMVLVDLKPDFKKVCSVTAKHEVGGTRIAARNGARYRLENLLDASLVASANNATLAMADCVLPIEKFVEQMNVKAKALGAVNSRFYEPSGIEVKNITTAQDLVKILQAGFEYPEIQKITQKNSVVFSSLTRPIRTHRLKTTNLLLGKGFEIVSGKTGFLNESGYNFAMESRSGDNRILLVLLGAPTKRQSFSDAQVLMKSVEVKEKQNYMLVSSAK